MDMTSTPVFPYPTTVNIILPQHTLTTILGFPYNSKLIHPRSPNLSIQVDLPQLRIRIQPSS